MPNVNVSIPVVRVTGHRVDSELVISIPPANAGRALTDVLLGLRAASATLADGSPVHDFATAVIWILQQVHIGFP